MSTITGLERTHLKMNEEALPEDWSDIPADRQFVISSLARAIVDRPDRDPRMLIARTLQNDREHAYLEAQILVKEKELAQRAASG